jgi:hypothetical protein
MDLPETLTLDVPNLLTAAGVVVAVLAALYSARSARAAHRQAEAADAAVGEAREQTKLGQEALAEARRQNEIAGHEHRLDAYRALLTFRGKVTTTGVGFKPEVVWDLWEHAQVAEFYFSEAVATRLTGLVELSLAIQRSHEEWKDSTSFTDSQRGEKVRFTHDQFTELRREIEETDRAMRKELKITCHED